jgi:hypothetical protein
MSYCSGSASGFAQDGSQVSQGFGMWVLKTPVRAPKANASCERLIGTIRRECLDFLIPINERHLRKNHYRIRPESQSASASFSIRDRNHLKPKFWQVRTDTSCPSAIALCQRRFSAGCITNIG